MGKEKLLFCLTVYDKGSFLDENTKLVRQEPMHYSLLMAISYLKSERSPLGNHK